MKIYILNVNKRFQPAGSPLEGPPHNTGFTIEKDFLSFLEKSDYLTDNPDEADWHYIPIFWTYWNLNHNYGKDGKEELYHEIDRLVDSEGMTSDGDKTFTICQYGGGPGVDMEKTRVFLSAKTDDYGIPAPPIVKPHKIPDLKPKKKYFASFIGKVKTHPIRAEMFKALEGWDDIYLEDRSKGTDYYVNKILESYFVLCPRGSAAHSFRFFETMQLGAVPIYIGDIDARPFKKFIKWEEFSYFVSKTEDLLNLLGELNMHPDRKWLETGQRASNFWRDKLWNQGWCSYVIKELELISTSYDTVAEDGTADVQRGLHRNVVCKLINDNSLQVGVELGVRYGNCARMILDTTKMKRLYGVDHYEHLDKVYRFLQENLKNYWGNRYEHTKKYTDDALGDIPDKVDFIFVDADHSYNRVKSDLENWYPKLRRGGIMSGHDYEHKSFKGVKVAVDKFFKDKHKINVENHHVWWIKK